MVLRNTGSRLFIGRWLCVRMMMSELRFVIVVSIPHSSVQRFTSICACMLLADCVEKVRELHQHASSPPSGRTRAASIRQRSADCLSFMGFAADVSPNTLLGNKESQTGHLRGNISQW